MNKKHAALSLTLLLLCLVTALLTSCAHKHKPGPWQLEVEATCTTSGIRYRLCADCGEELERGDYEQGHSYGEDNVCDFCGKGRYGEEYLKYEAVNVDGRDGYIITGIGNCSSPNVTIPEKHKFRPIFGIADNAFASAPFLETVTIPTSITFIGSKAFYNCELLKSVNFTGKNDHEITVGASAFAKCVQLKSFVFPECITEISPSMFAGCSRLKNITLQDNLKAVGDDAFDGCEKLVSTSTEGVNYIGSAANPYLLAIGVADNNYGITSLKLSEKTKFIYSYAFAGCDKLADVTLPEGLLGIGSHAFSDCRALTALTMPSTLVVIGNYALQNCTALVTVEFSAALTRIGAGTFFGCSALTALSPPATLTSVGSAAFYGCSMLQFNVHGTGKYLGTADNPYFLLCGFSVADHTDPTHENTVIKADNADTTIIS